MLPTIISIFKNKSQIQDFSKYDESFLENILVNDRPLQPFHMECQFTGKRICYCRFGYESLMDDQQKQQFSRLARYLKNVYSGIDTPEYNIAFNNHQKIAERIRYTQEFGDLHHFAPKFKEFENREKKQREKFEQDKRRRELLKMKYLQDLQKESCSLCGTKYTSQFYQIEQEGEKIVVCHDCAKIHRPELITRYHLEEQLLHKRGKVPVHLQPLKERFKNKKLQKLMQKDKQKEELINKKLDEQTDPKTEIELQNKDLETDIRVCYNDNCTKLNDLDQILQCKSCERSFHTDCLEPQLEFNVVSQFDWFCTDCKLCIICWKSGKEEELLICDCCDRAYHMNCRKPKIVKIPEGKWFCSDCKSYCPVCYRVIQSDDEGNYVFCDKCELWIHFECENIPQKEIEKIQSLDQYICKRCNLEQKKQEAKIMLEQKLKNSDAKTKEEVFMQSEPSNDLVDPVQLEEIYQEEEDKTINPA